jgi:C4-dicarboxylate transporter DctQ subunit
MKRSQLLEKIEDRLTLAGSVCVILMMLAVTAEVISRKAFNYSIPAQIEFTTLVFIMALFFGLAYTQRQRGHVRMDLLLNRAKGGKRELLEGIALLIPLVPYILMVWKSAELGFHSIVEGEYVITVISFPLWPVRIVIPIGMFFLCLRLIIQIVGHFNQFRASRRSEL